MIPAKHVLMVFMLSCFPAMNVYAYLDPGAGSIILQAIIASVAVGLFTIKSWWYRLLDLFKGKHEHEESDDITRPD
jgi:hypothetical protein